MQGMGGRDYASVKELNPYKEGALRSRNSRFFDELNSWTQSGILRMLRKGDWKLVYDMQGRGEMYHLSEDPAELRNLYGSPDSQGQQMELLQDMLAWELRTQDPLPLPSRYALKRDPHNYWAPYRRERIFGGK